MTALDFDLRCDIDFKVRERTKKLTKSDQNEAYYNAGANDTLEIMACLWLSQLEKEEACLNIRESIINDEFEENAKDYFKASQAFNMTAQEYFKLGFATGFKLAVEANRNTLSMPALAHQHAINDDEHAEVEALLDNIDWRSVRDGEVL